MEPFSTLYEVHNSLRSHLYVCLGSFSRRLIAEFRGKVTASVSIFSISTWRSLRTLTSTIGKVKERIDPLIQSRLSVIADLTMDIMV